MRYLIRKANEGDKHQIAHTIVYSLEDNFTGLSKSKDNLIKVFENGIDTQRFIVADLNGKIVGITGCADCSGRAMIINKKMCRKNLGFFRGMIAFMVFTEEFLYPLTTPINIGYIDILGVLEEARRQGIAKAMLEKVVEYNPGYNELILNTTDINLAAIKLYENFGFVEYERKPYKWAKQAGFKEKIWMRYTK